MIIDGPMIPKLLGQFRQNGERVCPLRLRGRGAQCQHLPHAVEDHVPPFEQPKLFPATAGEHSREVDQGALSRESLDPRLDLCVRDRKYAFEYG